MKKLIFILSILLNVALIFFLTYKSGIFNIESTSAYKNPYYEQKVTLFEYLPNDSTDIIFIGNSLTDRCEWHEILENSNIKNRGIGSDDTNGVLKRIQKTVRGNPDKVFLMLGVNDISLGISPDTTMSNYQKIIESIKHTSPKTEIFVQSILPINSDIYKGKVTDDEIKFLNNRISQLEGVIFIDLYSQFEDNGSLKKEYTDDGIHLLGNGYVLWKENIQRYVNCK